MDEKTINEDDYFWITMRKRLFDTIHILKIFSDKDAKLAPFLEPWELEHLGKAGEILIKAYNKIYME